MSGYRVVWHAWVQSSATSELPEVHLDRAVEFLRHHHYVIGADQDYDPDSTRVAFGLTVETATRTVAIHRASIALRESLRRAGVGAPWPRPYGPKPVLRLDLEAGPHSARRIGDVPKGQEVTEGPTKTGWPGVVSSDPPRSGAD